MNNQRRKQIQVLMTDLERLQGSLDDVRSQLETIRDEEQETYDNMPEAFQNGERGELAQAAADALGEAVSTLEEFDFDSITDSLNTACE